MGGVISATTKSPRVLNDLDRSVVNFHSIAKTRPADLINAVRTLVSELEEIKKRTFSENGELSDQTIEAVKGWWKNKQNNISNADETPNAAAWKYVSTNGAISVFGAGQRIIKTDRGKPKWNLSPLFLQKATETIGRHHNALKHVEITSNDAREVLRSSAVGDLVPIDPPYVPDVGMGSVADYEHGNDLTTRSKDGNGSRSFGDLY